MNYINLSATPLEEESAQLGADFYLQDSAIEAGAFIGQLNRAFPQARTEGVTFVAKQFSHDFGIYTEVVAEFDDSNEAAVDLAYQIESENPLHWDVEALSEMAKNLAKLVASDSEMAPGQRYAWMAAEIADVQQGRDLIARIRQARRGSEIVAA